MTIYDASSQTYDFAAYGHVNSECCHVKTARRVVFECTESSVLVASGNSFGKAEFLASGDHFTKWITTVPKTI